MNMTLRALWEGLEHGRGDFLVMLDERISCRDMATIVMRLCARFDDIGLVAGERIVIRVSDEAAAISAFLAALLDGLVPVMLTPETPPDRAAAVARQVTAKAAVVGADKANDSWLGQLSVVPFQPEHPRKGWFERKVRGANRVLAGFGLGAAGRAPVLPQDLDGTAYLLFTSGTTSQPSGVVISRRNLLANVKTIARVLNVGPGSRVFNDMVLAHGDGLVQGPLLCLASRAALIRAGGFALDRLEDWLDTAKREQVTHFITVPTVWSLVDRYALHDDYFSSDRFVGFASVAAALDGSLWDRIESRFGRPLTNQYGLTETVASALYAGPGPGAGRRGSIGRPVDCEARIVPLAGDAESADGHGELQLKGPNIFAAYWMDPEKTKASFTDDGWMRTGDLARQDPDGNFQIVGRIKRIIMTGGYLIRPEEIDEAMCRHPSVISSVTIELADELFGEIAVSLIETHDTSLDEIMLTRHAIGALEPHKVPKRLFPVAGIPRGPAGKPRLDMVRDTIDALMDREAKGGGSQANDDLDREVLKTAAQVFRTDPAQLSPRSTPDSVNGWDSFQQVNLIFALEDRFSIRIPTAKAAAIRSLGSAIDAVRKEVRG
jgi:long-chain acyl-CoA synthetase